MKSLNQYGQSTMELLVTTALVMFIAIAVMQLFTNSLQASAHQQALETRARLIDRLLRTSGMAASIRASASAAKDIGQGTDTLNAYLEACVTGGDFSVPCVNNNGDGLYRPFRLYMPMTDNPAPAVF